MDYAMKQAAYFGQPIDEPVDPTAHFNDLRSAINDIMLMYLPQNLTIKQADTLAAVIFDICTEPEKYLNYGENTGNVQS